MPDLKPTKTKKPKSTPSPEGELYIGLQAIGHRLGIKGKNTVYRRVAEEGLPVVKSRLPGLRGPRVWTSEALIQQWRIAQSQSYRAKVKGFCAVNYRQQPRQTSKVTREPGAGPDTSNQGSNNTDQDR